MQELEKILEEIDLKITGSMGKRREGLLEAEKIIRKHLSRENGQEITSCSRDNAGWIPVEEKPTEDGFYVATMSGELVDQEEPFVGLAEFEDGNWVDGEDVIAWQPLPEPYRPERQKNDYKGEQK